MNVVLIALGVLAIVLLVIGGFFATFKYFLVVGIAVAVIALIALALRVLLGRRS